MDKKQGEFNQWMKEFSDFLNADEASPPQHLTARVQEVVCNSLNPSPFLVFAKLATIAVVASSLTLLFCPQFGLGTNSEGLMPYLMKISPLACQFGCGVLFVGVGVFVSTFILRPEELRILRETKFLQVSALTASMLGMFICIGSAEFFALEWTWLLGGIVGGLVSVSGGSAIRERSTHKNSEGFGGSRYS